jgi:CheY-like chemotaxis protein
LFFILVRIAGGARTVFLLETTLTSHFILPLLLIVTGAIFVFQSYRRRTLTLENTSNDDLSQGVHKQYNTATVVFPSPPQSLSQSKIIKGSHADGALSSRSFDTLAIDFNVRTTIEETVSRFTLSAKEKGIELSCLFSADSPVPFRGDPSELRLILLNLIDYAISSMNKGEIVVRGILVEQTATHATFRLSVSSLPTTPTVSLLSILGNSSSDQVSSATPLSRETAGLALSEQIVKNWGGEFGFEKNTNFGATVWFTVTLEKPPPQVFSDLVPPANLSGSRVLLVSNDFSLSESDIHTWELTSHSLSPSAPIYSTLTTAAQEGRDYNILLLHCHSLDADTLALVTRIRANQALASLRLVLLTNWGRKGDARQVRQASIDAYLTFPVDAPLLFECLAAVLSQPPHSLAPELPLITRYTLAETRLCNRDRVLILDSNLSDQKHAVRLVEELGYRADVSMTESDAINATEHSSYVAILLPIHMPGIDGITVATQIRKQDRQMGRATPLIAVLQSQSQDKQAPHVTIGVDAIIRKPLQAESLKTALERCRLGTRSEKIA